MRHYLLAMDPPGVLRCFMPFEHSREALAERFRIEQRTHIRHVVVIGAPDLKTLMYHHPHYFVNAANGCFFCRSYLDQGGRFRVHILETEAKIQGHCLFCHQAYPRTGFQESEAFLYHTPHCPVLAEIG